MSYSHLRFPKDKILNGRKVVDAYRQAHTELHSKSWRKDIPEAHTPLLVKLIKGLEKLTFISASINFEPKKTEILAEFFDVSEELNITELGFEDRADFEKRATERDREALDRMWH